MPHQVYKNSKGVKVPSVTTIIGSQLGWSKNALFYWAVKMMKKGIDPIKERDKAAELGTLIHAYIEAEIYGTTVELEEKQKFDLEEIMIAEAALSRYRELVKEHNMRWLEVEYPLVSDKYKYGGCLDGVGVMDDYLFLGDTKSSNSIYGDHIVQLGGYRNLLLECTDYRPEKYFFIKTSKDKETILEEDIRDRVKLVEVPEQVVISGFEVFLDLLDTKSKQKTIDEFLKECTKT